MAAATVLVVVLLVTLLALWAHQSGKQIKAAWTAAAEQLSSRLETVGSWYNRSWRIDATVDEQDVRIDHYTVSTGRSAIVYTRLCADAAHAGKLELTVAPKSVLSDLGRALGILQDVPTGEADFDDRYVVKANDEDLARAWLTAEVRQAIKAARGYTFKVRQGQVTVTRPALESDAGMLAHTARAAAALAGRGAELRRQWERFAAAESAVATAAAGGLRIDLEERSVPLRIEAAGLAGGPRTVTRITGQVVGAGQSERYELAAEAEAIDEQLSGVSAEIVELPRGFVLGSSEPRQTARRLSPEVCRRLDELSPARVESDGRQVTILLKGIETDEERLRAAMALATELATEPSPRPYR